MSSSDNLNSEKLSAAERQQYHRHLILDQVGLEGQLRLKQAKVLVIGAGGLGCPVLQYQYFTCLLKAAALSLSSI